MLCRTLARRGIHRVEVKHPKNLSVPCAQRWSLRLASASIFNEYIDPSNPGSWQVEDERHLSPEFHTFTGHEMRSMRPGYGQNLPEYIMKKRLPNGTHYEMLRKDLPVQDNAMYGKQLWDVTVHGASMPTTYRMHKDINKAQRNDRKISSNRFKIAIGSGAKNPPEGFQAIPDETESEE